MPATLPMSLWFDLLGKPFRDNARGPDAYDCVGLLLEIQRRLGRSMPNYASVEGSLALALIQWEPVSDPQPGDAILFYSTDPRWPWHVATVTGNSYMIHPRVSTGVIRERYNAFPWQSQIEGFYRWKQV